MVTLPLGTYFFTVNFVFHGMTPQSSEVVVINPELGNSTWAGVLAAVMANIVLIAYVVMAFKEDEAERKEEEEKEKKKKAL